MDVKRRETNVGDRGSHMIRKMIPFPLISKGERNKVMDRVNMVIDRVIMDHCKRKKVLPSMTKGEIVEKMLALMSKWK
jgi:transcription antitermination factor NusA-like protein